MLLCVRLKQKFYYDLFFDFFSFASELVYDSKQVFLLEICFALYFKNVELLQKLKILGFFLFCIVDYLPIYSTNFSSTTTMTDGTKIQQKENNGEAKCFFSLLFFELFFSYLVFFYSCATKKGERKRFFLSFVLFEISPFLS